MPKPIIPVNSSGLVRLDLSLTSALEQNILVPMPIGAVSNSFELPTSMEFVSASESMLEPISSFAFDFGPSSEFMFEPMSLSTPEPMQARPLESVAESVFSPGSMSEPIPSFSVDIEPMSPSAPDFVLEFMPVSESVLKPISSFIFEPEPELVPVTVSDLLSLEQPLVPQSQQLVPQDQQYSSYFAFIQMLGVEEENIFSLEVEKSELALSQLISAVELKKLDVKELLMRLGWVKGPRRAARRVALLSNANALHCHRLLLLAYIIVVDKTMSTSRNIKAILTTLYEIDNLNNPPCNEGREELDRYVTSLSDWCKLHLGNNTGFIVKKVNRSSHC